MAIELNDDTFAIARELMDSADGDLEVLQGMLGGIIAHLAVDAFGVDAVEVLEMLRRDIE